MLRLALFAAVLALPAQAFALSCASGPTNTFPEDGTEGVPTNAVVRVMYLWETPEAVLYQLVDAWGEVVEAELIRVSGGDAGETVWALEPAGLLAANAEYRVEARFDVEDPWVLSTFTTGAGPDDVAPADPVVLDVKRDRGHSIWGSWRYNEVLVAPSDEPVFYEVDVASDRDFSDVRTVQTAGWLDDEGRVVVSVGDGLCGGALNLEPGDRHVRIRAIDLAGNVSETPEAERVGCSSLATPMGGLGLVLALGGVLLRRRVTPRRVRSMDPPPAP